MNKITHIILALSAILTITAQAQAQSPTGTKSRLMAFYNMTYDGTTFKRTGDSVRLFNHGSDTADIDVEYTLLADRAPISTPFELIGFSLDLTPYLYAYYDSYISGCDSLISYSADTAGAMFSAENGRYIPEYNAAGDIATVLTQHTDAGNWVNSDRRQYTYDAAHRITEITSQHWNAGAWENDKKNIFTYNTDGKLTGGISQEWSSGAWQNEHKANYAYNTAGDCISEIDQEWDSGAWENDIKFSLTYDIHHNVTEYIFQVWDSGAWENDTKSICTYNSENQVTHIQNQWISESTNSWEDWYRVTITYNSGKAATSIEEGYDNISMQWGNSSKVVYNYDSSDDMNEIIVQHWNDGSASWKNFERRTLEHNSYHQLTSWLPESWQADSTWAPDSGMVMNKFFYETYDDGTGIGKISTNNIDFSLYPNPAKDQLYINTRTVHAEKITVVDMSGKTIFETRGKIGASLISIPTAQLAPGMYVLQVTAAHGRGSKTFIRE